MLYQINTEGYERTEQNYISFKYKNKNRRNKN